VSVIPIEVTLVVLFFCFVVHETPVDILVAADASVDRTTDPTRAAANTTAFVFFIIYCSFDL
jgi:hypothetical protein